MNLFQEFQEFRKILCICPCCNRIVRVSDLKIKAKGKTMQTWLDLHELKERSLENKETKFEEKEDKIREKNRENGRMEASRIVTKIVPPILKKMKIDISDLIPIMHPIDYLAFDGMDKRDSISKIIFLSKATQISSLKIMRSQIKSVIEKKQYSWQTGRITNEGNITFE